MKPPQKEVVFGHVSGRDLYFHYPSRPEAKVLRGLNVSVSPGETLAVVGSSGSGKSTLVSLIERFYTPTVGIVTLDGQDIAELDLKWLRSQIGYVQQEPVLFDASIADNIRYGDLMRDVTDKEIVEVAKACNIHNFILSLPQVYLPILNVNFFLISNIAGLQYKYWGRRVISEWWSEAEDSHCQSSREEPQNPTSG